MDWSGENSSAKVILFSLYYRAVSTSECFSKYFTPVELCGNSHNDIIGIAYFGNRMLVTCCTVRFVEILKLSRCGNKTKKQWYGIERFHMMPRSPYWCSKTMKRWGCWCYKPTHWELNSFTMYMFSIVPINLHRCCPRDWKRSISLRTLPSFPDATTGFPAKWRLRTRAQKFHTDDVSLSRSSAISVQLFLLFAGKPLLASRNQMRLFSQANLV